MTEKMYSTKNLNWDGLRLHLGTQLVAAIVEAERPKMYRIKTPDGRLSDMVNLSRAKDAALTLALGALNKA